MTCKNCNKGIMTPKHVDEPSDSGHFSEEWECNHCGASGYIHGKEGEPCDRWDRFGAGFDGGSL